MTKEIHFTIYNAAWGTAKTSGRTTLQTEWDLDGMVDVIASGTRSPDHLTLCEAEQWYRNGGELMWSAAHKLNKKFPGRAYMPALGTLTHGRGPVAPCMFVDLNKLVVRHWHDGTAPDFYGDARNRMIMHLPEDEHDQSRWIRVRAFHLCPWSPTRKKIDAETMRNDANHAMASINVGDTNQRLSGPGWEATDLDDPNRDLWHSAPHRDFEHQRATGEIRQQTSAMDYMCGWWDPKQGKRVGGMGLHSAAELVGDKTPTKPPLPNGRKAGVTTHALVNTRWRDNITHYGVVSSNGHSDHEMVEVSTRH